MKVLEPIPLQTAGFVQACQHLLDLVKCRSQMFLSIQSPTEADRSLGVSLACEQAPSEVWKKDSASEERDSVGEASGTRGSL